jgi:hypothetical protein
MCAGNYKALAAFAPKIEIGNRVTCLVYRLRFLTVYVAAAIIYIIPRTTRYHIL